ncbi:MAG: rluD [Acidimicrobiales bacterium]|nr:rluD [Acidimicrobiales bacterium]
MLRREVVPPAVEGERLDRVVALITGLARARATALVAEGKVRVDGRPASARAARVAAGSTVEVEGPDDEGVVDPVAPDPSVDVPVVHADDAVIVVDKPAGLVVHPGAGHRDGTLVGGLLARYPELAGVGDPERPGLVHRLDRGTSGLLVVARTQAAHADLVAQLAARTVERRYAAVVLGVPEPRAGVVDAPIGRSARDPTRMTVSTNGRPARTHYQVEQTYEAPVAAARLWCRLETGRTHQVRVHLAAIGHPVVGDARYGGDRPTLPAPRPCLHAARLGFRHPVTGEAVAFESPLPDDVAGVLAGLS